MSKREIRSFAAAGVDVDAPRAKRRKEAPATSTVSTSPNGKADDTAPVNGENGAGTENATVQAEDPAEVKEKGLQVWHTVKDAVNKEGQIASFPFMRLPSRRQYPDYYELIKRPVALDDIKTKLDRREYASLEDLRQDFDTCFRNAKRYNMKESQIFKDAKFLHKLATKELNKLAGNEDDGGGSDDEEKKKKGPTLYKLLKTRLQKLVDKIDSTGRVLSTEFMELPSRKEWPIYYTLIKKPQCIENIFKKLKRKEYPKPADFANDVELVFSNALEFNQEHTQIWEDAVALRDFFRKLMSDLPEPYSIPAYANVGEHPTKIKLRLPQPQPPPQPPAASSPTLPSSNSITIPSKSFKKEAATTAAASSSRPANAAKSPIAPAISPAPLAPSTQYRGQAQASPKSVRQPALAPAPPQPARLQVTKPALSPSPLPSASSQPAANGAVRPAAPVPTHAPTPVKAPSFSQVLPTTPTAAPTTVPAAATAAARPSPPAQAHFAHPLRHAVVTTVPLYRRLVLDHSAGVRTWALRLDASESVLVVSDVVFLPQEDASSAEEEEDGDEDAEKPSQGSPSKRRSPRKRGKGAKAGAAKGKSKGKAAGAADTPRGEVQVKINGEVVTGSENGTWQVPVGARSSVLEVGEQGGMVWRVYLDRVTV